VWILVLGEFADTLSFSRLPNDGYRYKVLIFSDTYCLS
jgi:hypothetical protein